jgi:leader peptidase (prepilin peptidase)/N-methyltransferase
METLIAVFVAVFGLIWGSFLNVVIHRLPAGQSLFRPRSHCPQCLQPIRVYDNVPLLSFLILGGRCRHCRRKIPLTYPLVELLTGACFLTVHRAFGLSHFFFASCVFACALIVLGFIDFRHQVLPDAVTLPGFALAFVYSFFREDLTWSQSLLGAAVGGGAILLFYGLYYLVRKREGLGLGDATLMFMVGAFLGWKLAVLTLLLGTFAGALAGVSLMVFRKKGLQHAVPFGSFLAPAAFVALVWGERIVAWYIGLYRR